MSTTSRYPWVASFVSGVMFPHRSEKGADKKFFSLLLALHDIEPDAANELLVSKEMTVIAASGNFSANLASAFDIMADRNQNHYSVSFLEAIKLHRGVLRSRHWRGLLGNLNGNTIGAWKFFAEEMENQSPVKFTNQGSFVRELNEWLSKLNRRNTNNGASSRKMESVVVGKSLINAFIPKLGFEYDNLRTQDYLPANNAWDRILGIQTSNPVSHHISSILDCSLGVGIDLLTEHYLARILKAFAKQNWLLCSQHGLSENTKWEKPRPYDEEWVNFATHVCDSFVVSNPWDVLKEFNLGSAHLLYCAYKKKGALPAKLLDTHKKLKLYHAHPTIIESLEKFLPTLSVEEAMGFSKQLASAFCFPVKSLIAEHAVEIITASQPPSTLYPFFDLQYRLQGIQVVGEFSDPDFRKSAQQANVAQCSSLLSLGGKSSVVAADTFNSWYTELKLRNAASPSKSTDFKRPKV